MTQTQNNPRGIVFILLGMATFSIQDALIKFIYEDAALYELYFGRTLVACILLIAYLMISKQKINLKTHYPVLTILRVICFFFVFSFFYIHISNNLFKGKNRNKKMDCNFCWFFWSVCSFKSRL